MFSPTILMLAQLALAAPPITIVAHARSPIVAPALADLELDRIRGGLRLPNGLDVTLGIDLQTRVNGDLALRTVYSSEGSQAGIRVFTDGTKPVASGPPTQQTASSGDVVTVPWLAVDRSPTGTTIVPGTAVGATTVNLVSGDPAKWQSGAGLAQVPVVENGPAVAASSGDVTLTSNPGGSVVTLRTPTLEVQQLVGQATGVVVANTANNQTIETVSAVNVDLQGLSPSLLSGIFAAQRMALEAVTGR